MLTEGISIRATDGKNRQWKKCFQNLALLLFHILGKTENRHQTANETNVKFVSMDIESNWHSNKRANTTVM